MTPQQPKPNLKEKLALIDRFLAKGDMLAAESTARQLLAAYPRRAEANHRLGLVLSLAGRPEHAEDHLRRAVEAEKTDADYRLDFGQCLLSMGRVVEARAQFERARAIAPQSPRVNWKWGSYLLSIGRGEEALAALDSALSVASAQDAPLIHLDKVDCLLSLARTEQAEHEIRARLSTTPFRSRYLVLLSQIRKPDASSEVFSLIEKELARPGLVPLARSDLMLRKGSLLAQSGRHEEAFRSWIAAKQLLRANPRGAELARVADERIAAFPADAISRLSALYGSPGPSPIFVIGLPRSGTTLVSEILAAHDQVGNAGEIETMTWIAAKLRGAHRLADLERTLAEQGPEKVRALASLYGGVTAHLVSPKPRSVDKMPNNFLYLPEIAILFPGARFIDCTRHPADIFISAIQTEMNDAHAYSHDPEDFALYHHHHRRLMQHWKQALPGRIFELSYEKLVTEPRTVVSELLTFLGLPWQDSCLSPGTNASTVRTFSRLQVKSAIHAGSVGRWKDYAEWLGAISGA
jgi:tetratricopeptide (TPR) repeat protein